MTTYRILIVDDHREIRSAFRTNIELLDADLEVYDVPSGEEAMLEVSIQKIDLLIADVRLPGLSGLELLEKIKTYNPDMKIILVTGLIDANIRRQVADAAADAFFLKPVEMPDLLDAVERCLGLVAGDAPSIEPPVFAKRRPTNNVSERLAGLRQELNAFSAVLLDDHGKVLARAGGLPDAVEKSQVLPTLMATFSVVNKISLFLGKPQPEDLWYFSGIKYDLFWSHVGVAHALLVAANPIILEKDLAVVIGAVNLAGRDLVEILNIMGVTSTAVVEPPPEELVIERLDTKEFTAEDENVIKEILHGEDEVVTDELNAYWDSATNADENTGPNSADALSYEQARQLGLAPEDE